MSYFASMGSVWVTLRDGSKVILNDITAFAKITNKWKNDARLAIPYQVKDGELPHMISQRLYGTVDYWWAILMVNDIYDLDEQWPRNQRQLNEHIARKYNNAPRTTVHHYRDPNGLIADLLSLRIELGLTNNSDVINQAGLEAVTIEEFEIAANDQKRNIILIDPDYIQAVHNEYEKAMGVE